LGELSDSELVNFVAWGLDRESTLLRRPPDEVRGQWMSARLEDVDDSEISRNSQLGETDAACSWDFLKAERLYANKTIGDDC
jgi:hypothetical protein